MSYAEDASTFRVVFDEAFHSYPECIDTDERLNADELHLRFPKIHMSVALQCSSLPASPRRGLKISGQYCSRTLDGLERKIPRVFVSVCVLLERSLLTPEVSQI